MSYSIPCERCGEELKAEFTAQNADREMTELIAESNSGSPFVVLDYSETQRRNRHLSSIDGIMTRILEIASCEGERQYFPVCSICWNTIVYRQDFILKSIEEQENMSVNLLKSIDDRKLIRSHEQIQKEEEKCSKEYSQLLQDLRNYSQLLSVLQETLEEVDDEIHDRFRQVDIEYSYIKNNSSRIKTKNDYLTSFSLLKDCFSISLMDGIPAINGFRLGRLKNTNVKWSEINSALGEAILLLETIAQISNFEFTTYRLLCRGRFSKIMRKSDNVGYNLFVLESSSRMFDSAIVFFLECIEEMIRFSKISHYYRRQQNFMIDMNSPTLKYSIIYNVNDESKWTKALKYMLCNLKFLMNWVNFNYQ